jgi:hypothetical protein
VWGAGGVPSGGLPYYLLIRAHHSPSPLCGVIPLMYTHACVCDTMVSGQWAVAMAELSRVCYSRWYMVQIAMAPDVEANIDCTLHFLNIHQLYHKVPGLPLTFHGLYHW